MTFQRVINIIIIIIVIISYRQSWMACLKIDSDLLTNPQTTRNYDTSVPNMKEVKSWKIVLFREKF